MAKLESVCRILEPLHKPLLIHLPFGGKEAILTLADRYPRGNFLLAHCAFPYFDLIWPELKKRKTSTWISPPAAMWTQNWPDGLSTLSAPYHVLYGSDGPYGTPAPGGSFDMQAEYEFATRLIRAEELRAIRKNNFVFMTNN